MIRNFAAGFQRVATIKKKAAHAGRLFS